MTCIVAVKHKNQIYVGADSAGVNGLQICVRKDSKLFVNGPFIIGFTTSFRMGQILRYHFSPPDRPDDMSDDIEYLVTKALVEIQRVLTKHNYTCVDDNVAKGGNFILAYKNNLYEVQSNFQLAEYHRNFLATGCGKHYALGSMHANSSRLNTGKMKADDFLLKALQAAEEFSAGVCGPFNMISDVNTGTT